VEGTGSLFFNVTSVPQISTGSKAHIFVVVFSPDSSFVGIARAEIRFRGLEEPIRLTGLSTKALEGENEPPLSIVLDALDVSVDIGWNTLGHHTKSDPQGTELKPSLFKRAGEGPVKVTPVARYSPPFAVTFGYYESSAKGPMHHHVGTLAETKSYPEHQTLFPALSQGQTSFTPGTEPFGFYAISPDHTVYSEDVWNILFQPGPASHAMRIYPVSARDGAPVSGTYLVCIEEAQNGDYNDYVFLISNVTPVDISDRYQSLFNGRNLNGWYTWLQSKGKNNDPDSIFRVLDDETIHDAGKELGYIMTERSFGNYHFLVEFKWGEKRYPPRESEKRDSGICYNVPEDEPDHIWPTSVECQIQEGDVGDFWLLGFSTIQVNGKQNRPLPYSRIVKEGDAEKTNGEWNTVEVISFDGRCAHLVNGQLVNYGVNASLTGGRILLQSEYAEIYFRNIRLREF
jgi:hypothetical protein